MRPRQWLGGALLAVLCAGAEAHAHLEEASPANNSVLAAAPAALTLRFSEAVRLTALWIAKNDEPQRKLAAPPASQMQSTVALPPLAPGRYTLSWRALSADGHVVPGQIHFTLTQ